MGYDQREPTARELTSMRDVLDGAMKDGAFGSATALIYPPGAFAGTDELAALCDVVVAHRGVHITHVRSESDLLLESIDEAIDIAARSGVSTEIYHLKAIGPRNWGKMAQAIARIDAARAAGWMLPPTCTRMKPRPPVSPRASLPGRPPTASFTKTSAIRPCASRSQRRCVTPRTSGSNLPSVQSRCSSPGSSGRSMPRTAAAVWQRSLLTAARTWSMRCSICSRPKANRSSPSSSR